jgi:RNA polymerase sigma factor (sigma-70 family)
MAIPQSASILYHLRQTVLRRDGAGLTDGQLLHTFLHHRDEAAFEALVRRHGPMVRGVCRRVLRDSHDADDAFQAAFLVLLRKVPTLATREVVGDWLHGVAYRTALKARAAAARRRLKERQTARREAIFDEDTQAEWRLLLDQEIGRLPEKYRMPLVLCDLEGRTRKEAAQQLGWPEGTVSGRLSRARAMLARRLTRRGITLSAGVLATGMASEASVRVPFSLVGSTCKAGMSFAAGSAAGSVPAHIVALAEGVVKAMLLSKVKKIVGLGMIALVLTAGAGAWRYAAVAGQAEKPREEKSLPPKPALPKVEEPKDQVKIPPTPASKRSFRIDLDLTREKDGQRKILASPRLITLEGTEASVGIGNDYVRTVGSTQFERFHMGTSIRIKVTSAEGSKLCLIMTVSEPTRWTIDQEVTVESRSLKILRLVELGQPITVKLRISDKDQNILHVTAAVQEAEKGEKDSEIMPMPPAGYSSPPTMPKSTSKKDLDAKTIAAAEKDLKC